MAEPKKVESKIYKGGVPTDTDVRMIRDMWPDETLDGHIATKEEVAELIGAPVRSYRFGTVTSRWRRFVEEDTGKIIGLKQGKFYVLSDTDKVDLTCSKQRTSIKAMVRSAQVSSRVDRRRISAMDKKRIEHAEMVSSRVLDVTRLHPPQEPAKLLQGKPKK